MRHRVGIMTVLRNIALSLKNAIACHNDTIKLSIELLARREAHCAFTIIHMAMADCSVVHGSGNCGLSPAGGERRDHVGEAAIAPVPTPMATASALWLRHCFRHLTSHSAEYRRGWNSGAFWFSCTQPIMIVILSLVHYHRLHNRRETFTQSLIVYFG